MSKLQKVNTDLYRTEDGRFELRKEFKVVNKRMNKVYRLYDNGKYCGMPDTVKDANEWIKNR